MCLSHSPKDIPLVVDVGNKVSTNSQRSSSKGTKRRTWCLKRWMSALAHVLLHEASAELWNVELMCAVLERGSCAGFEDFI